uniref:Uncharacterized protein n=1 Tax=viral metagenome TaxID=1070528 RepID=A0A6C0CVH7_9ZZZZ
MIKTIMIVKMNPSARFMCDYPIGYLKYKKIDSTLR